MGRTFGAALGVSSSDLIKGASFVTPLIVSFSGFYLKNGPGGLGNARIFDKEAATPGELILRNSNATSGIRMSRSFTTTSGLWETTDAEAVQNGKIIHIGMAYDASSTANTPLIYINGRPVTVSTITAPAGTANQGPAAGPLSIGNRTTSGVDWDGALCGDHAMWGGVMLSQGQFAGLARGMDPKKFYGELLLEVARLDGNVPISRKFYGPLTRTGTRPFRDPIKPSNAPVFGGQANAYTLACAAGSFTLSGQAAGLAAQRRMPSAAGSFVLAGQAAGLPAQRRLPSSVGAFTLSGQAAILASARRLASAAGAFSLTGIAARLAALRNMPAGAGAFTLTGVAAGLRSARNLVSGTGAFVLSGQAATLTYQAGHTLAAAPGSFILTGIAARLAATRILVAAKGTFTLTGQTAGLSAQRRLSSAAGAFTLTGRAAVLSSQRRLTSAPGSFILAGQAATLRRGARLGIGTGVFILTGQEVLLSGSSALIGGGSPARTFSATIREATFKGRAASTTFKGARRDDTFRRQG